MFKFKFKISILLIILTILLVGCGQQTFSEKTLTLREEYQKAYSESFNTEFTDLTEMGTVIYNQTLEDRYDYITELHDRYQNFIDEYENSSDTTQQEMVTAIKNFYDDCSSLSLNQGLNEYSNGSNLTDNNKQQLDKTTDKHDKEYKQKCKDDLNKLMIYFD